MLGSAGLGSKKVFPKLGPKEDHAKTFQNQSETVAQCQKEGRPV